MLIATREHETAEQHDLNEPCGCNLQCGHHHETGRQFYVTIKRGMHPSKIKRGWLLGPYETHQQALDNVERGSNLACAADPRANFDAFGTASLPPGATKTPVFGS